MVAACKRTEPAPPEPPRPVASVKPPADHLAPGELVEGTEDAFGLKLPRDAHVEKRLDRTIYAHIQAGPQQVAAYMQARLEGGAVQAGQRGGMTIAHARPRGSDGGARLVFVRVQPELVGSAIEVRDDTPPPKPALPDDDARWRAAGLQPDGTPIDPTKLQ